MGQPPKIRYLEITSFRNTISPKRSAARKIPWGAKQAVSILNYSSILSYRNLCSFSFSRLFTNFWNYYITSHNFPPMSNYPFPISGPLLPINDPNSKPKKENSPIFSVNGVVLHTEKYVGHAPVIRTRLVKTDTYLSCWLVHFSKFRSRWFIVVRFLKSHVKGNRSSSRCMWHITLRSH